MGQTRRWIPSKARFTVSMVLILTFLAALTMTHAAEGKAKVDRLVMGLINPYHDYVRAWISGTADHNIQHDPMLEWLFEIGYPLKPGQLGKTILT